MRKRGPLSGLVTGALAVAVICALIVEDGWLLALPIILAVIVVIGVARRIEG